MNHNKTRFKQTEIGKIPEKWEVVRLGEVAIDIKQGRILPTKDIKDSGDYPVYGANGIIGFYTESFVPKNKVLITCRGSTCGTINFTLRESFVTNNAMIIYEDYNKINWKFLCYVLMEYNVLNLKTGSGQPQIIKGTLINHLIPLPPLPEQKKIAYVLSVVQEAEEKTDKYIQALRELKKSAMKHLFTYGAVPFDETDKVELKETEIGRIPKEWDIKNLKEVFTIFAGGDVSKINFSPIKTGKFIYPIYSNSKENNGLYGYSDTFKAQENSITITGRGNLGYAIPRYEKFTPIIRLLVLTPKFPLNIKFVSEFINAKIRINLEGSSIPQLTVPKISIYTISLPPLPEQQRIASILSGIDEQIEAMENKKKAIKELFNSLLKNLMTAKTRVNHLNLHYEATN